MRIYVNPQEAAREVERDLFEMGHRVHPQTMQDKDISQNTDYETIEVNAYSFKVANTWGHNQDDIHEMIDYVTKSITGAPSPEFSNICDFIEVEHSERWSGQQMNPGSAYLQRYNVWEEFLHDGKFEYTYSERMAPQIDRVVEELANRPDTRQAIIQFHNRLCCPPGTKETFVGRDLVNMAGPRIPCSMHYQFLIRNGALDIIYVMRSCDFRVHFPVDFALMLMAQIEVSTQLGIRPGYRTMFFGSLHAYAKDLEGRGIF